MKKFTKLFVSLLLCLSAVALVSCGKKDPTVTGIEVSKLPDKIAYVEGETFDKTGMEVKKVLSDGNKEVITDYKVAPTTALSKEDKEVVITYQEFTAKITITVSKKVIVQKKLVDIEFKVDENFKYVRTMDIANHVQYCEVYDDGSKGEFTQAVPEDFTGYSITEGKLNVTASLFIKNKEWNKDITVALDENVLSVSEVIAKGVSEEVSQVNGVIVSIATLVGKNEIIIMDKTSGEMIGVTGMDAGGKLWDQALKSNGFKVGQEVIVPVKLVQNEVVAGNSNSGKVYAEYAGGSAYNTAVVNETVTYSYDKSKAIAITSQSDLANFLSADNRANNFYQLVKFHGTMNYVYYEDSAFYRIFFDNKISNLDGQKIDGASPVFNNGTQFYTTNNTLGEMVFGDANVKNTLFTDPATATKDIYALFIGGNTYYHNFVILKAEDVTESTTGDVVSRDVYSENNFKFDVNSTFTTDGLTLRTHHTFGEDLVQQITLADLDQTTLPDMTKQGVYTVKGTKDEVEFTFDVCVLGSTVSKVELVNNLENSTFDRWSTKFDIVNALKALQVKVTLADETTLTVNVSPAMVTLGELNFGENVAAINVLGETINVTVTLSEATISVAEIKANTPSEVTYALRGIVLGSTFTGGTTAEPSGAELLLKDATTSAVIGLKGLSISVENKLAGLAIGDEIIVKVTLTTVDAADNYSEYGKVVATKVTGYDIVVVSHDNSVELNKEEATLITDEATLNAFLASADVRKDHAYSLVKLSAGAKFVSYNGTNNGFYISYNGFSVNSAKIDHLNPYLHEMNMAMTMGEKTYMEVLFGAEATQKVDWADPFVLAKDIYLMYVGGTGSYYHQFILLGEGYVTNEAAENLKEIVYTKPDKFQYNVGEAIDFTGAKLNFNYYYEAQNKVVDLTQAQVVGDLPDTNVQGAYTITFKYLEATYSFDILVSASVLESIDIAVAPNQTVYGHRDNINTIDLTGAKIKLIFADGTTFITDLTRDMLPAEDTAWKMGKVEYTVTYNEKVTTLTITYENRAVDVADFNAYPEQVMDLTGIVVGPASSHGSSELLIKSKTSEATLGLINNGIVGAYNNLNLDTTVVEIGDEIIVQVTRNTTTKKGGSQGRVYPDVTSRDNLVSSLIVCSKGNEVVYDFNTIEVVTISTQEELVTFLNDETRFYKFVKIVTPKGVNYNNSFRIFFDEGLDKNTHKVNGYSPFIYAETASQYLTNTLISYWTNGSSKDYNAPAYCNYDIFALFLGGNTYYHDFAVLGDNFLVEHPAENPAA